MPINISIHTHDYSIQFNLPGGKLSYLLTNNHIYPYQIYRCAAFYLILRTFLKYEQVCCLLFNPTNIPPIWTGMLPSVIFWFIYFSPIAVSVSSNFPLSSSIRYLVVFIFIVIILIVFVIKQIVIFIFIFIFANLRLTSLPFPILYFLSICISKWWEIFHISTDA